MEKLTLLKWYRAEHKASDYDQPERLYIFWSSTSQTLKELSPHRQVLQVLASDNAHLEKIHSTGYIILNTHNSFITLDI